MNLTCAWAVLAAFLATGLGAHDPVDHRASEPWAQQAEDGSWDAPAGVSQLSTTAAMLWVLVGDGHGPSRGSEKDRVRRAHAWIARSAFRHGPGTPLRAGEALAALAIQDLAWNDPDPETHATALRARARLLESQRQDGTWGVAGQRAGAPRALEATGWAVLALQPKGVRNEGGEQGIEAQAAARGAAALASSEDRVARAFVLYLDAEKRARTEQVTARFEALYRGPLANHSTPLLDLLATATAFRVGGDLWRSYQRAEWTRLLEQQLREGPRRGQWPDAGDPRGPTWELALRLHTLAIGFHYGRTALARPRAGMAR